MRNLLVQASLLAAGAFLLFSGSDQPPSAESSEIFARRLADDEDVLADSLSATAPSTSFNTTGRLVLSVMPRSVTAPKANAESALRCMAEAVATSDVHVVLYTHDEELVQYVEEESSREGGRLAAPMEVYKVQEEEVKDFTMMLKRLATLHPEASGYGWMNGDICPTAAFIDAANAFIAADDCSLDDAGDDTSSMDVNTKWRFVSNMRYQYDRNLDEIDPKGPDGHRSIVDILSTSSKGEGFQPGLDIFVWNREMFLEHLLPTIPNFKLPLWVADRWLIGDATFHALVLITEYGWSSDAVVYHLGHYGVNKISSAVRGRNLKSGEPELTEVDREQSSLHNLEQIAEHFFNDLETANTAVELKGDGGDRRTLTKEPEWENARVFAFNKNNPDEIRKNDRWKRTLHPEATEEANDCIYSHDTKTFECARNGVSATCKMPN